MEIRHTTVMADRGRNVGDGATCTPLYPARPGSQALLSVDLWRVEPGGSTSPEPSAEEQVLYVVAGRATLTGPAQQSAAATMQDGAVVVIGPHEVFSLHNPGPAPLTVLVSAPLIAWSHRALGLPGGRAERSPEQSQPVAEAHTPAPVPTAQDPQPEQSHEPAEDISRLMRRASELQGVPRPERRRSAPEPEPAAPEEPSQQEEEEEAPSNLMELLVVFEGRVRGEHGGTGQGYGRYSVQSPGRNPVVKTAEFGEDFTRELAEYETLIECLQYIIQRLTVTNRSPSQVQLDITSSNDTVIQQLIDEPRIRDQALRRKYDQSMALLREFAEWQLTHQPPEATAAALRFQ